MQREFCGVSGVVLGVVLAGFASTGAVASEPGKAIRPQSPIQLFNGKNLDGLYTWLTDAKYEDPRKVFTVEDGLLRISGDGLGYICTKDSFKDYRLVVEYRWGGKTWGKREKRARDTGVIVHCQDPDGSYGNTFMAGIEAQIIEGGTGRYSGVTRQTGRRQPNPGFLDRRSHPRPGRRNRLAEGWYSADAGLRPDQLVWDATPDWADVVGFRGKRDIESPGQEWTHLEIVCDGGHIVYRVNGVLACEGFDSLQSSGKILLQTELAEAYIRRFELLPLDTSNKPGRND